MGKLDKTDKTGKTVEAWWALLFAEGSLGQSIIRWGWPVIGGALGAWVASATDWIGSYGVAGWAATIAIGVLTAIWCVAGFEHIRTKRWVREQTGHEPSQWSEDSALVSLIDARLDEIVTTKVRSEFVTHSQQHAQDEKLASIKEDARKAQGMAGIAFEHVEKERARLDSRIGEIARGCFDLEKSLMTGRSSTRRAIIVDLRMLMVDSAQFETAKNSKTWPTKSTQRQIGSCAQLAVKKSITGTSGICANRIGRLPYKNMA